MTYNSANSALKQYFHVIKLQTLIGGLVIVITAIKTMNFNATLSAVLGYLLVLIPTLVYIKIVWSKKVLPPDIVFARHKKAEIYKFFSNLLGFILVFIIFRKVHALALFTAYVVTLSSYWFCMLWQAKSKS